MDRVYIDVGKEGESEALRVYPGSGADYTLELIHRYHLHYLPAVPRCFGDARGWYHRFFRDVRPVMVHRRRC